MKTYVAVVRDHSGSMGSLSHKAREDYNLLLQGLKSENQDIIVTVIECGVGPLAKVVTKEVHKPVNLMQPLSVYTTDGSGTPLWDSVGVAINELEMRVKYEEDTTAFLVMVITDGEENRSKSHTAHSIAAKIKSLQATDRWTFAFRVPVGYKRELTRLGIPDGNVIEWEQTTQAFETATKINTQSINTYFAARSSGARSVNAFYVDTTNIAKKVVTSQLDDVSTKYHLLTIPHHQDGIAVKDFCLQQGFNYSLGKAFYQLVKPEDIQNGKKIMIRDKSNAKIYAGQQAHNLLGLPNSGPIKVRPTGHGNFDVFVQSTSVNRKLPAQTMLLYAKT